MSLGSGVIKRPLLEGADDYNDSYSKRPQPYKVLSIKIINPDKPIDVHILYKICKPYGQVVRIVIFRTNGVDAMVDSFSKFDSIETARKAKDALNGEDIYADCCTLKIYFAKPQLTVLRNTTDSWDYTNPNLPGAKAESEVKVKKPLIREPLLGAEPESSVNQCQLGPLAQTAYTPGAGPGFVPTPPFSPDFCPLPFFPGQKRTWEERDAYLGGYPPGPDPSFEMVSQVPSLFLPRRGGYMDYEMERSGFRDYEMERSDFRDYGMERTGLRDYEDYDDRSLNGRDGSHEGLTPVFMVYKLDPFEATPDRLFNIFSIYGHVKMITFIKRRPHTAMVEMANVEAVERIVKYLKKIHLFGRPTKIWYSKKNYLTFSRNDSQKLPSGSRAVKDFSDSDDQRFKNLDKPPEMMKFVMKSPTKLLHFFNAPPNITTELLLKVFEDMNKTTTHVKIPHPVIFAKKPSINYSNGTLEFSNIEDALNALAYCNNAVIEASDIDKPGKLRMCYYKST